MLCMLSKKLSSFFTEISRRIFFFLCAFLLFFHPLNLPYRAKGNGCKCLKEKFRLFTSNQKLLVTLQIVWEFSSIDLKRFLLLLNFKLNCKDLKVSFANCIGQTSQRQSSEFIDLIDRWCLKIDSDKLRLTLDNGDIFISNFFWHPRDLFWINLLDFVTETKSHYLKISSVGETVAKRLQRFFFHFILL